LSLITNLSSVEKGSVERYIQTQLIQESYKLQRENQLQQIEIAKEQYVINKDYWLKDYVNALTNYTVIYAYQGKYEKAINIQKRAIKLLEENKEIGFKYLDEIYMLSLVNIGELYSLTSQFDKAYLFYKKSHEVCKRNNSDEAVFWFRNREKIEKSLNLIKWRLTENNNINSTCFYDKVRYYLKKGIKNG